MDSSYLFDEFPAQNEKTWANAMEKHLKGAALSSLDWSAAQNLLIAPYPRPNNAYKSVNLFLDQGKKEPWLINETILVEHALVANKAALKALEAGSTSITFKISRIDSTLASTLLKGIHTSYVEVNFTICTTETEAKLFIAQLVASGLALSGNFSFEQLSTAQQIDLMVEHGTALPKMRWFELTLAPGTEQRIEDLATVLGEVKQLADLFVARGIALEQLSKVLVIHFWTGNLYFIEIATIRAFKRLWLGLLEAYALPDAHYPHLTASTLSLQKDMYWNMIASTSQAMAASIGGVNQLTVTPVESVKSPEDFAARIARNVQHLLIAESYLDKVDDIAHGAYYIETITLQLIEKSWQIFCRIQS